MSARKLYAKQKPQDIRPLRGLKYPELHTLMERINVEVLKKPGSDPVYTLPW